MFIDKNSLQIKIPGGEYVNLGNFNNKNISLITQAKYGYNKLWGENSGRNLAGKQTGTLIGIFPKIVVSFRKLTKTEFETIAPIIDAKRQIVSYYDPKKKQQITMETYTGDYEVINKNIINNISTHKNESFEVSFIAIDRRR